MEAVEVKYKKYESYKESMVSWIGNMPQSWDEKRLKFVVEILKRIIGYEGPDVLSITQQGIKIKDVTTGEGQLAMDYSKYQIVNKGDFAMNHMDLLTGYVDISKFDGVISPDYRVFKIKDKQIDAKYLLILFQKGYNDKIFYAYGQGVSQLGRWRFPADNFNNFRIPLPSIEEQTAIANFLDNKTTKIATTIAQKEKMIELLKERKQIIIQNAVTKGLDPNVKMKDSGVEWIGEIPEHWEVKKMKYVFDSIQTGTTPPTSNTKYFGGNINWYNPKDLNNEILGNSEKTVSELAKNHNEIKLFEGNSILIVGIGATSGKTSYLPKSGAFNQQITGFHSNKEFNLYFFYLLKSLSVVMLNTASYTTLPILNNEFFKSFWLIVPPQEEQLQIVSHIETQSTKIDKAIALQQMQIEKLKEYKATLIDSAVTGKIKVC